MLPWLVSAPLPPVVAAPAIALSVAATRSVRPEACRAQLDAWQRAREPGRFVYCARLARGWARLAFDPASALLHAEAAESAWPGHGAPAVLAGRALLASGDAAGAVSRFDLARERGARELGDPEVALDTARALLGAGRAADALAAYRGAVASLVLLSDDAGRRRARLEVALALAEGGPDVAPEAEALLAERDAAAPPAEHGAHALRGLLAALGGEERRAQEHLARAGRDPVADLPPTFVAFPTPLVAALRAFALERRDRKAARSLWEAALTGPLAGSPWAASARARVARWAP